MSLEAIKHAIPHREPFLLLDEIVEQSERRIICRKTFTGKEWWYAGHYPSFPITPGVLLCEAAMQAGAVLLAAHVYGADDKVPVATRANNVQFKRMVRPGDTITIEAELKEEVSGAYYLTGRITVDGKLAARLEFACTLAALPQDCRMPADFLQLADKNILVMGVANKRSVAYQTARLLDAAGAKVVYSVRSKEREEQVRKLVGDAPLITCDVEHEEEIVTLSEKVAESANGPLHGLLHSIAFADYEEGVKPFHQSSKQAFLRAVDISCYSLIAVSNALRNQFDRDASVVTISISTTRMASENYGFMAPVKAALDSSLAMLAKSFSCFSQVRFNAVAAGLLKTSASAGIPGYIDAYLYAEQVIPRMSAVTTDEVAATAAFLLSPRSSGINAQRVVVDAGMEINYFDREIIQRVVGS